ncbi:hypothetical protein [Roseibacillus ishigakijimensis]|uniref:Uncharacterized protein n=1 Tax=Roseibacillus ishigakijimensis TaxID=454146 RepID=A0A934RR48_9BACT|nr:hypothetical protein [Roseibacillus ishigakijimensis]MBK1835388.1 hypothetical protein [Roseibacillus ishigakijimensis]
MKPLPTLALTAGALAVGFSLGRITAPEENQDALPTPTKSASGLSSANKPVQSFRLPEGFLATAQSSDYKDREALVAGVALADIPATIDRLLQESGPEGMDYQLRNMVGELLEKAMAESPENTLSWVLATEHLANRDFLFEQILNKDDHQKWVQEHFEQLLGQAKSLERPHEILKGLIQTQVEDDPRKAIALSKEYLRKENGEFDFPRNLQKKAVETGWELAFDYFKDSWQENNRGSSWRWGGDFPADFDFASFAKTWAEHEASLDWGEDGGFYATPTKIWQEWSQADPQAAFEFFETGGSSTFGFSEFFSGYQETARPEDIFNFARQLAEEKSPLQSGMESSVVNYAFAHQNNLRALLDWTRDTGDLSLLTASLGNGYLNDGDTARGMETVLHELPATERLAHVREAHLRPDGSIRLDDKRREWFTETLQKLGHSEGEIQAALAED